MAGQECEIGCESRLWAIEKKIAELEKQITGQEGLHQRVAVMEQNIETIHRDFEKLQKTVEKSNDQISLDVKALSGSQKMIMGGLILSVTILNMILAIFLKFYNPS